MAASFFAAPRAEAAQSAKLVYVRSGDGAKCPDEDVLRRAVAARVGYDPFFGVADRTVVVGMRTGANGGLVARIEIVDSESKSLGDHEITSEASDCRALFQSTALAVAIAIDPQALSPKSEPEPPRVEPTRPPPEDPAPITTPTPATDMPPKPTSPRTDLDAALTTRGAVGIGPAPSIGVFASLGFATTRYSIAIEGGGYAPSSTAAPNGGRVHAWLVAGSVVPCLRVAIVGFCGVGTLGRLDGNGTDVSDPSSHASVFFALGPRVEARYDLSRMLALVGSVDALANLHRSTLRIGNADVWTAPIVAASVGAGLSARF